MNIKIIQGQWYVGKGLTTCLGRGEQWKPWFMEMTNSNGVNTPTWFIYATDVPLKNVNLGIDSHNLLVWWELALHSLWETGVTEDVP